MKFQGKVAEPNRVTEYVTDPKTDLIVAEIKDGVFETEDPKIIAVLKARGYEVIDEVPDDNGPEELTMESIREASEKDDLDSIKVKDLIEFAEVKGIDLGDAKKKADIVEIILNSAQ